jgi:hypothetical protein
MSVSFGERLVNIEIENLRRKLRGIGGKNLSPYERVVEINNTLRRIRRIHHDQKLDVFFSTENFREIRRRLESMLEPTVVDSH